MAVGEFTQYVSVFISSLAGAVSGYFYFNSPDNLRIKLERAGTKLLRPSDPLWMYRRVLRQKGQNIKTETDKISTLKDKVGIENIQNSTNSKEPSDEDAYKLLLACNKILSDGKWHRSWESWVTTYCGYDIK